MDEDQDDVEDEDEVEVGRDENANEVLAREIMEGKRRPTTRVMYRNRIRLLSTWIEEKHPQYYDSENKCLKIPIEPKIIMEFMAKVSVVEDRRTKVKRQASVSVIGSYRSAIAMLYEEQNLKYNDETLLAFTKFAGGYKRLVADKKLNGEMKIQEGKSPITFQAYNFVAKEAMKTKGDHSLGCFAHLFLILCWTLMARSVSVGTILLDHLSWENDALLVSTPKHKGDQEGNNCYPKHVYANPDNPFICPILSMAIHFFSGGWRRDGSKQLLFQGTANEGRFSKWLRDIVKRYKESLEILGILSFEVGTHSFRKGVATFAASCPGGPSTVCIFLRAGWSLGAVTSRYIFAGHGGDQVDTAKFTVDDPFRTAINMLFTLHQRIIHSLSAELLAAFH